MLKSISLLLLSAVAALAQISGAGQMGCTGTPITGSAWTTSTSNNTTQPIATNTPFAQWQVTLDMGANITGGQITFQSIPADGNAVTTPTSYIFNAADLTKVANPYTLVASTNVTFVISTAGYSSLQMKLTSAITTSSGAGTVTPYFQCLGTPTSIGAVYKASPGTLSDGQGTQFITDNIGQQRVLESNLPTTVDTNNGTTGASTPRVTISSDSTGQVKLATGSNTIGSLTANQSVNTAQVNGVTALTGAGATGTGSQRETVAQDTTTIAGSAPGTAGTASSNVVTVQGITSMTPLKVDGSATNQPVTQGGNFQVRVQGNAGAAMDAAGQNATSPANSLLIGGQFNTSPTTITSGNMSPLQLGNNGHLLVTPDANSAVNVAQVNGSTAVTAATGVQKVGVVGNAGGAFDAASGAAPPANALFTAGLASGATGGLLLAPTVCDQWVAINGTASAQLIAGVSGRKIFFCSGNIQMNGGANTISFVSGTGTTCATGTTAVPGFDGATSAANGYSFAANGGMAFGGANGAAFARTSNNADNFCILVGSATRVVGGLSYAIY